MKCIKLIYVWYAHSTVTTWSRPAADLRRASNATQFDLNTLAFDICLLLVNFHFRHARGARA